MPVFISIFLGGVLSLMFAVTAGARGLKFLQFSCCYFLYFLGLSQVLLWQDHLSITALSFVIHYYCWRVLLVLLQDMGQGYQSLIMIKSVFWWPVSSDYDLHKWLCSGIVNLPNIRIDHKANGAAHGKRPIL